MKIKENKKAPLFKLFGTRNTRFDLKKIKSKLVVYFYPKDDTPGCTLETKDFSKFYKKFKKIKCEVIGISKDTVEKQIKFKSKYDLKCILGSDVDIKICSKFGVWVEKSMYGKKYMGIQRSTFLINIEGKIQHIWNKVKVPGHPEEVLEVVKKL